MMGDLIGQMMDNLMGQTTKMSDLIGQKKGDDVIGQIMMSDLIGSKENLLLRSIIMFQAPTTLQKRQCHAE